MNCFKRLLSASILAFFLACEGNFKEITDEERAGYLNSSDSKRTYKTADYINRTTSGSVSLQPPTGGTIAEIEIYALGAGGGGQGGNYSGMIITEKGTGGAGGAGAASYAKLGGLELGTGETVSLNVTIGSGGSSGTPYKSTATQSGNPGGKGANTTVSWAAKSITISAEGGSGGGKSVNDKLVDGGAGGRASSRPTSSFIIDWSSVAGATGGNGNFDSEGARSNGGKAATITKGSLSSFGGGNGATWNQDASPGGGGSGGYYINSDATSGKMGGNGIVTIVYKYYMEE